MPRAPPYTWSRVTLSTILEPCSLFNWTKCQPTSTYAYDKTVPSVTYFRRPFIFSMFSGNSSANRSFRVCCEESGQWMMSVLRIAV
jgi:hypothetical protein